MNMASRPTLVHATSRNHSSVVPRICPILNEKCRLTGSFMNKRIKLRSEPLKLPSFVVGVEPENERKEGENFKIIPCPTLGFILRGCCPCPAPPTLQCRTAAAVIEPPTQGQALRLRRQSRIRSVPPSSSSSSLSSSSSGGRMEISAPHCTRFQFLAWLLTHSVRDKGSMTSWENFFHHFASLS